VFCFSPFCIRLRFSPYLYSFPVSLGPQFRDDVLLSSHLAVATRLQKLLPHRDVSLKSLPCPIFPVIYVNNPLLQIVPLHCQRTPPLSFNQDRRDTDFLLSPSFLSLCRIYFSVRSPKPIDSFLYYSAFPLRYSFEA